MSAKRLGLRLFDMKRVFPLVLFVTVVMTDDAPIIPPCGSGRNASACVARRGTDWYGGDMIEAAIEGLGSTSSCCMRCRSTPGCVAYIYRLDHDHCWLKNELNDPSPCDACSGQNFREQRPSRACKVRHGTGRTGGGGDLPDMPLIMDQPGPCCDRCRETPGVYNVAAHSKTGDDRFRLCGVVVAQGSPLLLSQKRSHSLGELPCMRRRRHGVNELYQYPKHEGIPDAVLCSIV